MIISSLPASPAYLGAYTAPPNRAQTASGAVASSQIQPGISYSLDPQLGITVLQLRDTSGKVVQSRPTQQQLDAYKKPGAARPALEGRLA